MRILLLITLFTLVNCTQKPQTELEEWQAQAEKCYHYTR